jgi:HEAT repeat protein
MTHNPQNHTTRKIPWLATFLLLLLLLSSAACTAQSATQAPLAPSATAGRPKAPTQTAPPTQTPDPLAIWIAELHSPDLEARKIAASMLGETSDPRAIDALIAALVDDDGYTSQPVLEALVSIGDPAVEPLLAALQGDDENIRFGAVEALGQLKEPRAVPPLVEALKAGEMIFSATYALSQIGAPAIQPLVTMLEEGDINQQYNALGALGMIKEPEAIRAVFQCLNDENLYDIAKDILIQVSEPYAIPPALEALGDENEHVHNWAFIVLDQIGDPAFEPLVAALGSEDSTVRQSAVLLLGELDDPKVIEPVLAAVSDENLLVRRAALYVLSGFDDERARQPFVTALHNEDLAFIAETYAIFIRVGLEGSEPVLVKALEQYGSKEMAESYLNCGNSLLVEAATQWADSHGYTITQVPGSPDSSWGSGNW